MKKEGYDFDAIQESLTKEGYPSEEVNWVMANGIWFYSSEVIRGQN